MTDTKPREPREPRDPGYRGSLPPREDRLARPWLLAVIGIFVLIFVLAFLGVPSRFTPEPTPVPIPTLPPTSGSVAPSASAEPSVTVEPSG